MDLCLDHSAKVMFLNETVNQWGETLNIKSTFSVVYHNVHCRYGNHCPAGFNFN